ncbi:MAG TPA: phosphate ABC transporter permease PstA [Edaphocola sp.]|nr:phosphate ABC transporter permease PstA [Edaphocola sp.]
MNTNSISGRLFKSSLAQWGIISLAAICVLPLFFILYYIIASGIKVIDWSFLTHLPKPVGETGGGIANAITGTLIIVIVASVMAVPFGVLSGFFLYEYKNNRLSRWAGVCVDALHGIPSIVIGIVAYFWLVKPMGGFSGISGSLALAVMMLPVVIRSTEETLNSLPPNLREAAMGLGMPLHKIMSRVLLPCGFGGIISGALLAVARVAGETAPLLFTAFGNPFMNADMSQPMQTLPLLIFNYAMSPYTSWQELAWGAAFILLSLVLLLNLITKIITHKWKIQL